MSTVVASKRPTPHPRRISVSAVRAALEEVVEGNANRVDRRAPAGLPSRYVLQGAPNCLVAQVLARLGFSIGVLCALDREYPTGELVDAGVRVHESRHPALRKITTEARELLQYVQDRQDAEEKWGRIAVGAFRPGRLIPRRFDERRRPWLYLQ